jgi:hypothetical protein
MVEAHLICTHLAGARGRRAAVSQPLASLTVTGLKDSPARRCAGNQLGDIATWLEGDSPAVRSRTER